MMSPKTPSKRLYLRSPHFNRLIRTSAYHQPVDLPKHVDYKSLLKHLSIYGKITEVKIVHDYAFVQFESQKDAQDVVDTFQNQPFLGENITVEFARPMRKDMRPSISSNVVAPTLSIPPKPVPDNVQCRYPVVVSNIPRKIRWQELKDFGRLPGGLVAFCDLDKKHQGRGFVEYFAKEDAERAVIELDNTFLGGQRVRVSGRPENGLRGRSRSRSPRRRGARSYEGWNEHLYHTPRKSRSKGYRHKDLESSYDRYGHGQRHRQHRRSPPPAYCPTPPTPEDRSESQQHLCIPSDLLGTTPGPVSYPTAGFTQGLRYDEQYDYASHGAMLDNWKYDYDYAGGHVADPFEVPLQQTPGDQFYDTLFQPI